MVSRWRLVRRSRWVSSELKVKPALGTQTGWFPCMVHMQGNPPCPFLKGHSDK